MTLLFFSFETKSNSLATLNFLFYKLKIIVLTLQSYIKFRMMYMTCLGHVRPILT